MFGSIIEDMVIDMNEARLIGRCLKGHKLAKRYRRPKHETDALHQTLSGPATRCLMQRAFHVYGDARYERLATLSVGHLYNLRRQAGYQATRLHWTKTKGHAVALPAQGHEHAL